MLMRYAMLIGMAAAAVFGAIHLSANNSNMLLVDAGQGVSNVDLPMWVLGMIATFMVLSLSRVVIFGLPSMMDNWFSSNKTWLVVGGGGALICAALYLM